MLIFGGGVNVDGDVDKMAASVFSIEGEDAETDEEEEEEENEDEDEDEEMGEQQDAKHGDE